MTGVLLAYVFRQPVLVEWLRRHRAGLAVIFALLLLGVGVLSLQPRALGEMNHSWLALFYGSFRPSPSSVEERSPE